MDPSLWELPTPARVLNMKASELPLAKRLRFRIFGRVYLEHRRLEGWSGTMPFYLVRCPKHGPFEAYPAGRGRLQCPKCSRFTLV